MAYNAKIGIDFGANEQFMPRFAPFLDALASCLQLPPCIRIEGEGDEVTPVSSFTDVAKYWSRRRKGHAAMAFSDDSEDDYWSLTMSHTPETQATHCILRCCPRLPVDWGQLGAICEQGFLELGLEILSVGNYDVYLFVNTHDRGMLQLFFPTKTYSEWEHQSDRFAYMYEWSDLPISVQWATWLSRRFLVHQAATLDHRSDEAVLINTLENGSMRIIIGNSPLETDQAKLNQWYAGVFRGLRLSALPRWPI